MRASSAMIRARRARSTHVGVSAFGDRDPSVLNYLDMHPGVFTGLAIGGSAVVGYLVAGSIGAIAAPVIVTGGFVMWIVSEQESTP
jgi:hypothetical protein